MVDSVATSGPRPADFSKPARGSHPEAITDLYDAFLPITRS